MSNPLRPALDQLIAQWREKAKDNAKYGASQALKSHREYFGTVNAAFELARCADELAALLIAHGGAAQEAGADLDALMGFFE